MFHKRTDSERQRHPNTYGWPNKDVKNGRKWEDMKGMKD